MTGQLGMTVQLGVGHKQAIESVQAALESEGFGILTRIDIDLAFREKLGTDFRPYSILGACNPELAHAALTLDPQIGLMLPCNVTVEAKDDGGSLVRVTDPKVLLGDFNTESNDSLQQVARDANDRLSRVVQHLGGQPA